MNHKATFQLTIQTIVILILAIVFLVLAIGFVVSMFIDLASIADIIFG